MLPNVEQTKALVRWFLSFVSGIVTGYLGAKGILTADQLTQVTSFFSNETLVSTIVGLGAMAWGLWAHTQSNAVATVAAMPGTSVSSTGTTITVHSPELAKAAVDAATSPEGK